MQRGRIKGGVGNEGMSREWGKYGVKEAGETGVSTFSDFSINHHALHVTNWLLAVGEMRLVAGMSR